jgi:hypothetical protein
MKLPVNFVLTSRQTHDVLGFAQLFRIITD